MALHLLIEPLKTRFELDPVLRYEPSTYHQSAYDIATAPSVAVGGRQEVPNACNLFSAFKANRSEMYLRGKSSWCNGSSDRSFTAIDPLSYFSFQPVLHGWCNKGRGMSYPVCGMVLIGKSSPCGGSGSPPSLSE